MYEDGASHCWVLLRCYVDKHQMPVRSRCDIELTQVVRCICSQDTELSGICEEADKVIDLPVKKQHALRKYTDTPFVVRFMRN